MKSDRVFVMVTAIIFALLKLACTALGGGPAIGYTTATCY